MKNPPHPGEIIREEIIETLGLTVTSAAEILGVRRTTLSHVTTGKASVSAEMALRVEKAFGVGMESALKNVSGLRCYSVQTLFFSQDFCSRMTT